MEFETFMSDKKNETVQRMLTTRRISVSGNKSSFTLQRSNHDVSHKNQNTDNRNVICSGYKTLLDISPGSTVTAEFPTQKLVLSSFHQKFHKERWKSSIRGAPRVSKF